MDGWTDPLLRAAQGALITLAAYAVLGAAAVVMGGNGTETINDRHVGLAPLVLAVVWRRGVAMRDDLEGLV